MIGWTRIPRHNFICVRALVDRPGKRMRGRCGKWGINIGCRKPHAPSGWGAVALACHVRVTAGNGKMGMTELMASAASHAICCHAELIASAAWHSTPPHLPALLRKTGWVGGLAPPSSSRSRVGFNIYMLSNSGPGGGMGASSWVGWGGPTSPAVISPMVAEIF